MLYNPTHALAVNVDRVSPGPYILFGLVIFFGLEYVVLGRVHT